MEQLMVAAETRNLAEVTAFVRQILTSYGWDAEEIFQMELAVEEIFVNICRYAYGQKRGKAKLVLEKTKEKEGAMIRISDQGIPYDPLEREDPDISLGVQEREPGGLGIFFVKQLMDEVRYERSKNENQLILIKYRKEGAAGE